jgi:hypothetical protein
MLIRAEQYVKEKELIAKWQKQVAEDIDITKETWPGQARIFGLKNKQDIFLLRLQFHSLEGIAMRSRYLLRL